MQEDPWLQRHEEKVTTGELMACTGTLVAVLAGTFIGI
jgi:hypothetical protein